MVDMKRVFILMLELLLTVLIVQGKPPLNIDPAARYTGETLTVTCDVRSITTVGVNIFKDTDQLYTCLFTNAPCSDRDGLSDYADVDWTQTGKAVVIISNADSTRDDGVWTCSGDDTTQKSNEIYLSITDRPFFGLRALQSNPSSIAQRTIASKTCNVNLYWLFILMVIPCGGLVVVIIIVSGYKTLVIGTLCVKVTKNTVHLSWKPEFEFEPVPNTTYAKCAPDGLTENAEFIDGLFDVVFRDLSPERQHDVIIYCQNAADMKLYKSETFVVFTLKDSSNTNPKESNTMLALHSLDLTVSQRKVQLSWTSPISFDSTQVEYWVGSEKHITMSAKQTSLATSTAEMTRLLPERVITFTITGEKVGTKYPSGILHQKTLKDLTDCCP